MIFLCLLAAATAFSAAELQQTVRFKNATAKQPKKQHIRITLGYCSNGNQVVAACFPNYICGRGFWCDRAINRCCKPRFLNINIHFVKMPPYALPPAIMPTPPVSLLCRDGSPALSRCTAGPCPTGYVCTLDGLCCRSGTAASCNYQGQPIGLCDQGMCSVGHYCSADGYCCPAQTTYPAPPIGRQCADGQEAIGACFQGLCPIGYDCQNNLCCPSIGSQGAYITPTTTLCPDNAEPVGPCIDGLCPDDLMCINNVCCPLQGPWQPYSKRGRTRVPSK